MYASQLPSGDNVGYDSAAGVATTRTGVDGFLLKSSTQMSVPESGLTSVNVSNGSLADTVLGSRNVPSPPSSRNSPLPSDRLMARLLLPRSQTSR